MSHALPEGGPVKGIGSLLDDTVIFSEPPIVRRTFMAHPREKDIRPTPSADMEAF